MEKIVPFLLADRPSVADHTAYLVHRYPVPRKLHQPPRSACRCVGRRIGAHRQRRDDVEGLRYVPPDLLANRDELSDDLGELVRVLEVDREEPLEPDGTPKRLSLSGVPAHPHRDPRPLNRPGQEPHAVDRVVLTTVVHGLARPGGRQDLQGLVEHPCPPAVIEFLSRDRKLVPGPVAAKADAERQAAAAQPIKGRGLPGDLDRSAPGEWGDHRTESDRLCGGGDRRERDPGISDLENRLPPADVIPEKDSVPAGFLCLGGQPGDERGIRQRIEDRHEES